MKGRYFYFESNGSNKNAGNHYTEVQIVDYSGNNIASGKGLLRYSGYDTGAQPPSAVTDGNTNCSKHFDNKTGQQHIVIDLGDVYDIDYIKIWRYYSDGRVYRDVVIKVSVDDINYETVFSSAANGTYSETSAGYQINLPASEPEEPEEATYAFYNGVRLPIIPQDVLAINPYCFIRHNTQSGYYELYCSSEALFYISDNNAIGTYNGTIQVQRYRILIENAETADTWEYNSTSTGPYGVEAYRPILWSNCDISYKENTEIYFEGSEPVPEGGSSSSGGSNDSTEEETTTHYYRLVITDFRRQGSQVTYASLTEFTLYNEDGNNIARSDNAEYSANTYESSSEVASKAFDGSTSSRWHSLCSSPNTTNWIQAKLYNQPDAVSFGITPRTDYGFDVPWAFSLLKSTDGESWKVVYKWVGTNSGWTLGQERLFTLESNSGTMLPKELQYEVCTDFYPGSGVIEYAVSDLTINYVVPVKRLSTYTITMTEVGNRLRSVFTTVDPSTITATITSDVTNVVIDPTFSAGYTFQYTPTSDGWLIVYVSNAGETPSISIVTDGYGGDGKLPYAQKYLLRSEDTFYTVVEEELTIINVPELSSSVFEEYGFDEIPDMELIISLVNPEVLYWMDSDTEELPELKATLAATPPPQTIITAAIDLSDETIKGIETVTIDCDGTPLIAVSFDNKATWKAYDGTQWVDLSAELSGMSKEVVEAIPVDKWTEIRGSSNEMFVRMFLTSTDQVIRQIYIDFIN